MCTITQVHQHLLHACLHTHIRTYFHMYVNMNCRPIQIRTYVHAMHTNHSSQALSLQASQQTTLRHTHIHTNHNSQNLSPQPSQQRQTTRRNRRNQLEGRHPAASPRTRKITSPILILKRREVPLLQLEQSQLELQ